MWSEAALHTFAAVFVAKYAIRLLVLAVSVLVMSGLGHAAALAGHPEGPADAMVTALTSGQLEPADLPPDFALLVGYVPIMEQGRLVHPDGECSFPLDIHPPGFELACRSHDLGYDLLRFTALKGQSVGTGARLEIDRAFHRDLMRACDDAGCRFLAHLFSLAVTVNSIRQGYAPPTIEPAVPWIVVAGLTLAVAGYRRRPRDGSTTRNRSPASTSPLTTTSTW